jgi:hypothetical protein
MITHASRTPEHAGRETAISKKQRRCYRMRRLSPRRWWCPRSATTYDDRWLGTNPAIFRPPIRLCSVAQPSGCQRIIVSIQWCAEA